MKLKLIVLLIYLFINSYSVYCSDSSTTKGFLIFKTKCFGCHSLGFDRKKEGTNVRHVGKRHSEKTLVAIIRSPHIFDSSKAMPPVTGMSDKEEKELLKYLSSLK